MAKTIKGIQTANEFSLRKKEYLDDRQSFDTIADMASFDDVPDGFITLNKENGKRYEYNSSNTIDSVLGKWREVTGGSTDTIIKEDFITEQAIGQIDKGVNLKGYDLMDVIKKMFMKEILPWDGMGVTYGCLDDANETNIDISKYDQAVCTEKPYIELAFKYHQQSPFIIVSKKTPIVYIEEESLSLNVTSSFEQREISIDLGGGIIRDFYMYIYPTKLQTSKPEGFKYKFYFRKE